MCECMERVRITGTGSELQGVGRLADGRAVFVPGALPGEDVEIEITREAKRFCEARLKRVLEPSRERIDSACPHNARCGGCAARHMRYEYSLELKRQRVEDALVRIGGLEKPAVFETYGCDVPERTRNKAEYAVEARAGKVYAGCVEGRSQRVLPVRDCLLQREESVRALNWITDHLGEYVFAPHIRWLVTRVNRAGELTAVFSGDAPMGDELHDIAAATMRALPDLISVHYCRLRSRPTHALDGSCVPVLGARTMCDQLLGLTFELSPQAFFQVNPPQAEVLYLKALEAAGIREGTRVIDAYCGAGTITLAAADRGARAVGVEIIAPAIENAKRNAMRNNLSDRARFLCGDAAREIPHMIASGEHFDAAILDPPRKGADAALLDALADAAIPRIAYVSCDPGTLARDVKRMTERGYQFEWAQPVDMFPWTGHVEAVASMVRICP